MVKASIEIKLYGPEDPIPWPDRSEHSPECIWMESFLKNGVKAYIQNVQTRFYILQLNHWFFPITVNEAEYDNAYVCSPYTHYVSYARQELKHLGIPLLESALSGILSVLGLCLKAGQINRTVHVNNWLLSTNLYPNWNGEHLSELTRWLKKKFPNHAIVFRSLNEYTEQNKLQLLKAEGYQVCLSRQVYFIDGCEPAFLKKKDFKNDLKLLKNTGYQLVSVEKLKETDIARILELYDELYLDKYSYFNPQFTEALIRLCLKHRLLTIQGFRREDGVLDGVIGYFSRNGVMTTPLVGYNRSVPEQAGLYRLLTVLALQASSENKVTFNMSSGAAAFKRTRGAVPALEYSAVYSRHLSLWYRIPWWLIGVLTDKVAKPLMQQFKL